MQCESENESEDDSVKDKIWTPSDISNSSSSASMECDIIPSIHNENDNEFAITPDNMDSEQNVLRRHELVPQIPAKRKRSRWNKPDPSKWSRNVEKSKKYACLPYKTKKVIRPGKTPQPVNCQSCKFKCTEVFTEEDRVNTCKMFWNLSDYKRQKDFILRHVDSKVPARPGANVQPNKRRKCSRSFYFFKNETKRRVCQKFFEKTLNISNGPINKAFLGAPEGVFVADDNRGRRSPHNKTKDEDVAFVKRHIEMFPTMESHYCRKNSQRRYLDAKLSIAKMYFLYKEFCKEHN